MLPALCFGLPLAVFVAASPFYPIDHAVWLAIHNGLVLLALTGAAAAGWRSRRESRGRALAAIGGYTLAVAALYLTAYAIPAWGFAASMRWTPFFHRDYLHHGYTSVEAYLAVNGRELLLLHLFSWAIFSPAFVAAGAVTNAIFRARTR